jgi:hypothetical protein
MTRLNTKIDEAARRRLAVLQADVKAFGQNATHEAIVSALVLDTTVAHLAGTLMAYHMRSGRATGGDPESAVASLGDD